MATYMQAPGYGELNGWDVEVLHAFRASPVIQAVAGGIDSVAPLIPEAWLSAATGTPRAARYWQLENRADSLCIHESTAKEFEPALQAYAGLRERS
jgi:hypothetical protein